MAMVLVSGSLFQDPVRRTSKTGRPYATAKIREGHEDATAWWNISLFGDEEISEVCAMHHGDAIAVSGLMRAELYDKGDGKGPKISLSITVNRLVSHRRIREEKRERPAMAASSNDAFDDEIPF